MKKIIFTAIILQTFIMMAAMSQVTQEWSRRYTGSSWDYCRSIAIDNSGNVYVTGVSMALSPDYVTIKYNSSGVQQWLLKYNPANLGDWGYSIALDSSNNVYVTGLSRINSGSDYDFATIKYTSSGLQQWVARYNGPANGSDGANSIAVDGAGDSYVTGFSAGVGSNSDYATIKYNSSGVQQWVQRYNGTGNGLDGAFVITIDAAGNVYVTGESTGNGTGFDYLTIKYNSSGLQQWIQRYDGTGFGDDIARSIAVDASGNVYVTGESTGSGTGFDYVTIKYSSSGVQQWVQRYNGSANLNDMANSLTIADSGIVYVTGTSPAVGTNGDYATIKYNSSGVQQWVQRYDGPTHSFDYAHSITTDANGNIYVTGESNGTTNADYTTIKYNSSGAQQWVIRYDGVANYYDIGYVVKVDDLSNVYVTGWSFGNGTDADYATIKYSQFVGIQPVSHDIPESFELHQNYPNPFNPVTKIKFDIPSFPPFTKGGSGGFVNVTIYDILGSEVAILVNEQLNSGIYEVEFDGSNYPSGVYFYKLISGEFLETKEMILIK